jgi:hypothetical protein
MEIERIFDDTGRSWEIGKSYFGKTDTKLRSISDNTFWSNGELGFRGGAVNFALDFEDGTRIVMYPQTMMFVEMNSVILG